MTRLLSKTLVLSENLKVSKQIFYFGGCRSSWCKFKLWTCFKPRDFYFSKSNVEVHKQIFSNILQHKMKEISKNLPEDERKVYAEKMALAFYKSIGGESEDEE